MAIVTGATACSSCRVPSKVLQVTVAIAVLRYIRPTWAYTAVHEESDTCLAEHIYFSSLHANRKEEYQSPAGLAVLFDRAGGNQTEAMADAISKMKLNSVHAEKLIAEVREIWDTWDAREAEEFRGDDMLRYDSFYNGFMAPYFGCYRCWDTKKALSAIDMDADNSVDWKEFKVFLTWALHQYPDIKDTEELLDKTFRKGIIPAMHDEVVVKKRTKKGK